MAEKAHAPWHGKARRPEPDKAAARDAVRLEAEAGPDGEGSLKITVLLVGMTGELCINVGAHVWGLE